MKDQLTLEKYRIRNYQEEGECDYCGYPFYPGDHAYELEELCTVVCSRQCGVSLFELKSRGFTKG